MASGAGPLPARGRGDKVPAMPEPHVSLRVKVPLRLYERISAYRHEARHETRAQAMITLINAGLAALAKPPSLPARTGPIPYAGFDPEETRRTNGKARQ